MTDYSGETCMDTVAHVAYRIAEDVRDSDLQTLFDELVELCSSHPVKSAQVLMCLGAWFDPDTPTRSLWARVESITRSRVDSVMQRVS